MVRSAIGRGGCEVYTHAESLTNSIGVTMSVLDTHGMNTRLGPVIKHRVVNDVAHRHVCDERCHKIGNDIKVQV